MKKFFVFLLLLTPANLYAQTTPVPTNLILWDYDATLSDVNLYKQAISIDDILITAAPSCKALTATTSTCELAIPALTVGKHKVSIAAELNGQTAMTTVNGIDPATGPKLPKNPRASIQINIIIN